MLLFSAAIFARMLSNNILTHILQIGIGSFAIDTPPNKYVFYFLRLFISILRRITSC